MRLLLVKKGPGEPLLRPLPRNGHVPEKSGPADPREPRPAGRSPRWPTGLDFPAHAGFGEGSGFGVGFDFPNNGIGLCCISVHRAPYQRMSLRPMPPTPAESPQVQGCKVASCGLDRLQARLQTARLQGVGWTAARLHAARLQSARLSGVMIRRPLN